MALRLLGTSKALYLQPRNIPHSLARHVEPVRLRAAWPRLDESQSPEPSAGSPRRGKAMASRLGSAPVTRNAFPSEMSSGTALQVRSKMMSTLTSVMPHPFATSDFHAEKFAPGGQGEAARYTLLWRTKWTTPPPTDEIPLRVGEVVFWTMPKDAGKPCQHVSLEVQRLYFDRLK